MTRNEWRQVQPILTQALSLPEPDRKRLVDTAALHDVLRRELMELLGGSAAASMPYAFSEMIGGSRVSGEVGGAVTSAVILTSGDALADGRFVVVRQIGRGGMGTVYLAQDTTLGILVALKVVPLDDRLIQEAQRAAACSGHEHVATVHNVLRTDHRGQPIGVLVMDYVVGRPASRIVEDGPVEIERAVRWVRQAAAAVGHAHDCEVLHCDLKPANIMVTADDRVKVLDFGIARASFGDHSGPVHGTLPYMAPEQLRSGTFSRAGDVYSLGVTLFELLTGRLPFDGDPVMLRMEILAAPPPRLTELRPDAPPVLDAILQKALEKDPETRFRSARAFARALDRALEAVELDRVTRTSPVPAPIAAIPPSWQFGASTLAAGAVVLLGLLTFSGFAASMLFNSPLRRTPEFSGESVWDWPVWGLRALLAAAIVTGLVALGGFVTGAVGRKVMDAPPFRARAGALRRAARKAGQAAEGMAGGRAELLMTAQVAALFAFGVYFRDVFQALDSFITQQRPADLSALRPQNQSRHIAFGVTLAVQLWVFGAAWVRVLRDGLQSKDKRAVRLAAGGLAISAVTVIVGQVIPFRILYHNESEGVQYASQRCYIVGQRGDQAMLFCPLQEPPWNRVVRLDDPNLQRDGTVQNIFGEIPGPPSPGGSR